MKKAIMIVVVAGSMILLGLSIGADWLGNSMLQQSGQSFQTEQLKEQPLDLPASDIQSVQMSQKQEQDDMFGDIEDIETVISTLQKHLTDSDKAEISSIILGNITNEDITQIMGMMEDGLNHEELVWAKSTIMERLDEDELTQLEEMYNKYAAYIPK